MNVWGADAALQEFFGPRADDRVQAREMEQEIMSQGYTSSNNYTKDNMNKQTLNTVDVYFTGAGLNTDLTSHDMELAYTKKLKLAGKDEENK